MIENYDWISLFQSQYLKVIKFLLLINEISANQFERKYCFFLNFAELKPIIIIYLKMT